MDLELAGDVAAMGDDGVDGDTQMVGLATVITHRKNIMEKLGMKSVSALTIYAVMHGYVDINKI